METESVVFVIIPVHNTNAEYLECCVSSVLKQSYHNFKLILVDDGSCSDCAREIDKQANRDARCKAVHIPHGGVSNARNKGLEIALSEKLCGKTVGYVTFVDSDDWLAEKYLEILLQNIENIHLSILKFVSFNQTTNKMECKSASNSIVKCNDIKHIFDTLFSYSDDAPKWMLNSVWGKLYRLDLIRNGNVRFDLSLKRLEDGVFNLYYFLGLKETLEIAYIDYIGYYLRQHSESTVHKDDSDLAQNMILPLKRMYDILSDAGMYEEYKDSLAYRALLNCIIYINDGACGKNKSLLESWKKTKSFISTDIIRNLIIGCNLSYLHRVEKMVFYSIQKGRVWKTVLYFYLRKKIKH